MPERGQWVVTSERIGPSTSSWQRKLTSGEWEPFAVTGSDKHGLMWFKRWQPTDARNDPLVPDDDKALL